MTTHFRTNGTPSLAVPPTQNTALVLEFNCLYTHDLRRKQKRWQDGFLRFHTFNRRIMVYDIPRNFIGDSHWSANERFEEGVELTLDKGGAMVQVAESVGRTETDLTELRKSAKKSATCVAESARHGTIPIRNLDPPGAIMPIAQHKHRSLNTLLGKNRSRTGRAVLNTESPYDARQQQPSEEEHGHYSRISKKQKLDTIPTRHGSTRLQMEREGAPLRRGNIKTPRLAEHPAVIGNASKAHSISPDMDHLLIGLSSDVEDAVSSPVRITHNLVDMSPITPELVSKRSNQVQAQGRQIISISPSGPILKMPVASSKRKVLLCQGTTDLDHNNDGNKENTTYADRQKAQLQRRLERLKRQKTDTLDRKEHIVPAIAKTSDLTMSDGPQNDKIIPPVDDAAIALACEEMQMQNGRQSPTSPIELRTSQDADFLAADDILDDYQATCKQPSQAKSAINHLQQNVTGGTRSVLGDAAHDNPPVQSHDCRTDPNAHKTAPIISYNPISATTNNSASNSKPNYKKSRKPPQYGVPLDISAGGTSTVLLRKPFQAPTATNASTKVATDIAEPDPWSREAFDLFTWRPPKWNEEEWRLMT